MKNTEPITDKEIESLKNKVAKKVRFINLFSIASAVVFFIVVLVSAIYLLKWKLLILFISLFAINLLIRLIFRNAN